MASDDCAVDQDVECDQAGLLREARGCRTVSDRLRDLIDLVLASLDERRADGRALAGRAHFSRDHLDRLLSVATGETPVALRRRLLLERAAWQLRVAGATASDVAPAAGYASLAAFSRAFARAYRTAPSAFAAGDAPLWLEAPNGIHFHPPAGLLLPAARRGEHAGATGARQGRDLTDRLVAHHLERVEELLRAAATLPATELARPLRPGFTPLSLEGEEPSAALMAQRLVRAVEVWVAAIAGEPFSDEASLAEADVAALLVRFHPAARAFARQVRAIRDRGAWDDAFVDALCEPPQSFTYGAVVAHVIELGAVRREMLASVLVELGVQGLASPDAISWEQGG